MSTLPGDPERREVKADNATLVLLACIAASALSMIDGSMVNVRLPTIGRSLAASRSSCRSPSPFMGGLAGRIGPRLPLTVGPMIVAVGFLFAMRMPNPGPYWATLLPAMLVISLGMAGAVAPLTTAVLSSVEKKHTGTASGFNSAIARTGGLIATALLGGVLAMNGPGLTSAFRLVCMICAGCAAAAGTAAWIGLKDAPKA